MLGYAGAARRLGATIRTGVEVRSVETSGGEVTSVVTDAGTVRDGDGGVLRRCVVARARRDRRGATYP